MLTFFTAVWPAAKALVRISFSFSYAIKSGFILANVLSNDFIKDIFGCIRNSVFLLPTIGRCVVELRL